MPDDDELIDEEPDEEEELEGVLDADIDEEDLVDEEAGFGDDEFGDDVPEETELVDEEADIDEEPLPRGRKKGDEEDEDLEDLNPDDMEADLQSILEDRIAASDDEDEDEDEVDPDPRAAGEVIDGVAPKKANEIMCNGCFLLVSAAQFGKADHPRCPVGEDDCPAMAVLFAPDGGRPAKPAAKAPARSAPKPAKATGKAAKRR